MLWGDELAATTEPDSARSTSKTGRALVVVRITILRANRVAEEP
jgi:hypothetical protein